MLPPSAELLNPAARRAVPRAVVFDFDGTVSLVREGWAGIMADMAADLTGDASPAFRERVERIVLRQSGLPTVLQMRALADLTVEAGRPRPDPDALLAEFFRRLFAVVDGRKADLAAGRVPAAAWAVPGTHALLDALRARGVTLLLASGTDLAHVRAEAELLGLTAYFDPRIHGPVNDTPTFSKANVIDAAVREFALRPGELVGFGDGFAETVEVKRVGGLAVGVASFEPGRGTGAHPLKRAMLAELGADVIVPDYRDHAALVGWLFHHG